MTHSRSLLALGAALLLVGCIGRPHAQPSTLPDYALAVDTPDGWTLSLFRWPAGGQDGAPGQGTPVLLVPGTGMNRWAFTTPGSDLATHLSEQGFDVWIVEVRGSVSSTPPDRSTWRRGDWSIDDFARTDVPAALARIREETGRDEVFWVGHSLGAILGAIVLQEHPDAVQGLVGLGLAGDFAEPNALHRRGAAAGGLIPKTGPVATRALGKSLAPLVHLAPDSQTLHSLFNEENVPAEVAAAVAREGIENVGAGTARQLLSWAQQGHITSLDGTTDYSVGMADIDVPALLVAGRVDHVSTAWSVLAAYDRWGSTDKEFVVLGQGWGQQFDYGHGDLILGDGLEREVFPKIAAWLAARISGVEGGAAGASEATPGPATEPGPP